VRRQAAPLLDVALSCRGLSPFVVRSLRVAGWRGEREIQRVLVRADESETQRRARAPELLRNLYMTLPMFPSNLNQITCCCFSRPTDQMPFPHHAARARQKPLSRVAFAPLICAMRLCNYCARRLHVSHTQRANLRLSRPHRRGAGGNWGNPGLVIHISKFLNKYLDTIFKKYSQKMCWRLNWSFRIFKKNGVSQM
jgi:hypothetical protein